MKICDVINEAFHPDRPEIKIAKQEIDELGWKAYKARGRACANFFAVNFTADSPVESIPSEIVEYAYNMGLTMSGADAGVMTALISTVLVSYLLGVRDGKGENYAE